MTGSILFYYCNTILNVLRKNSKYLFKLLFVDINAKVTIHTFIKIYIELK